ncbi:protein ATP6V1FNB [Erinaceus europaeus]|uniref:Protein ATP6V1FNB n=1 Tax=Erinaceus europaeus TaxID=9365 RepID=A0ABM3YBF8_ERIEU|nr:protein ATP6V1FNB [Erinaceus europaeus]
MRDLCTTQDQAYWQERIHKEAMARAHWKIRHGCKHPEEKWVPRKQLQRAPLRPTGFASSPDSKEVEPETKGIWAQLSRGVGLWGVLSQDHRAQEAHKETQEPAGPATGEVLAMKKAHPSTLQLLFQGVSHDGQGRAAYLRERYQQKPEEKFPEPILSSWEHGWRLGDVMKNASMPTHARVQPIAKTFYIKGSVFNFLRPTDQLM